ncbi:MAG TPA: orotidine-5'-phosphate decarboxylase [Spirochaetota bacterium]|jgi:orotidine-5'-phosphate decarboxylase|nr:MAG: orotidine 5'-phosphate decarboxylase [Spirochaetes bacterium ADurb.BinA120]HPI13009.1 orotidine-5'-phosphate decarboxylase [Spirochaetota bacterium]
MDFCSLLKSSSRKFNSIVCLGLDPVLDSIPLDKGSPGERIRSFYETMLNTMARRNIMPAAVKPNYAFYAQYGLEGIGALTTVIDVCRGLGLPVILDVKRGDIGATAEAYAREAYDFFKADAVTLSPFLGFDSIGPFFSLYPEKGAYILNKTSNRSSGELQDLIVDGEPLHQRLSRKIVEWHRPGMGAVVGATYPGELSGICGIFIESGLEVPLLIPGIGSQGGSVEAVCRALGRHPDPSIHRINSSSAINYAYRQRPELRFDDAAAVALSDLNEEVRSFPGILEGGA